MIDIEKLEAVPTFVLLGKEDCQTVAAYVYENCTLIDLDLSRAAGGFVFLDRYCDDGSKEHDAIMDSDNFERVDYDSKTHKALVIRYRCEDGEDRAIGYCYTTDGQTMYGEYLKSSVGAPEIVQWHGKNAKELIREIAQESNVDLNNKSVVYKGYKGKEATNENTPQDFPKVRAACVQFAEALKWKEEAQEKLDAINKHIAAACALLPHKLHVECIYLSIYNRKRVKNEKPHTIDHLALLCKRHSVNVGEYAFKALTGSLVCFPSNATIEAVIDGGQIDASKLTNHPRERAALSQMLDRVTPDKIDEMIANAFTYRANYFDIDKEYWY